jgi:hypothetical protein
MLKNKFTILAVFAGTAAFSISGAIIWDLIMIPMQAEHIITYGSLVKGTKTVWIDILAQIPLVLALIYVFTKHNPSVSIKDGAITGALVCTMFNLSANLMIYSRWNLIDGYVIFINFIGMIIWGAIGGAAIAWVLGMDKKQL